jgi:hypothetical protein
MPFTYTNQIVQEHLHLKAMQLYEAAGTLPSGDERAGLLQRARRIESASRVIDRWVSSPGLRVPK